MATKIEAPRGAADYADRYKKDQGTYEQLEGRLAVDAPHAGKTPSPVWQPARPSLY